MQKGTVMCEICDKIRNSNTKTELCQVATDYEISLDDVIHLKNVLISEGTPCESCKNIDNHNKYPCNVCKRERTGNVLDYNISRRDYYENAYCKSGF